MRPLLLLSALVSSLLPAQDLYTADGFERFATGPIAGQGRITPGTYLVGVGTTDHQIIQSASQNGKANELALLSVNESRQICRKIFAGGGLKHGTQYHTFDFFFDADKSSRSANLLTFRGDLVQGGVGSTVFRITADGKIFLKDSPEIAFFPVNKWVRLTLALDLEKRTYTIATDGQTVVGQLAEAYAEINSFEWDFTSAPGVTGIFLIDNYRVSSTPPAELKTQP
jgi:hypothetical protein